MPEQATPEATRTQSGASSRASVLDLAPETAAWDAFVVGSNPGSYLQTSAWAEVKAPNGWTPVRFIGTSLVGRATVRETPGVPATDPDVEPGSLLDEDARVDEQPEDEAAFGAQLLLRQPRFFPWAFAYSPRGPILQRWSPSTLEAFTGSLRDALTALPTRVSHVRIEPEIEINGPFDVDGELRHALRHFGWRPGTAIQPPRTRQIDLRADEAALWGDLRKKWRQYVNKARRSEVRVVDATIDRLPEFYSIYQETARRAGFIIRTYESYVTVWQAFAKLGMVRLLMAETPTGKGLATLFVLRVGGRVIEPYGGMTAEGAESYDMWGLSHEGIEQFKSGFGGREIRYVGAWDLVIDPAGRLAFDTAQAMQDRVGRLRHGIRHVRGSRQAAGGAGSGE
jgi:lipid II:glycine glycyltransferase (peptidoglycan interpeptide bridge formation enzyme)